jgi:hypothetical protein
VAGRPREVTGLPAHVAKIPPLFPNEVVVEVQVRVVEEKREKEGGDGRPATHFGQLAKLIEASATMGFLSLPTPPRDPSVDFGAFSLNTVKMDLTLS